MEAAREAYRPKKARPEPAAPLEQRDCSRWRCGRRRPPRSGDQYLHREAKPYRDAVRRKLSAYHCHLQLGVVAQGLLQCLAVLQPRAVWGLFGSWLRTVRPGLPPSERVVALSLRNALPDFLADDAGNNILAKFIRKRIDPARTEGLRLAS